MIAYMLTWTTYGTWLQGDPRGWVKDGEVLRPNDKLESANCKQMKCNQTVLTKEQRTSAVTAIMNEAYELKQIIFALAVCDNHIHLVVENIDMPIGQVVSHYKNAGRLTIQALGFNGKLWTHGFDKRYCMDEKELAVRIAYVLKHKDMNAEVIIR